MVWRRAICASLIALAGCAHDPARLAAAPPSPACEAAAAFVRELLAAQGDSRPSVYSFEGVFLGMPSGDLNWFKLDGSGEQVAGPPALLFWSLEPNRSAVRLCANVRALLRKEGIRYGTSVVRAVRGRKEKGSYPAWIESVTLPVVSEDGRQAVLAESSSLGPLDGGAGAYFLERQTDGSWRAVGSFGLWVS